MQETRFGGSYCESDIQCMWNTSPVLIIHLDKLGQLVHFINDLIIIIHTLQRSNSVFKMKRFVTSPAVTVLGRIFLDLRVIWFQIETDYVVLTLYNYT